MAKDFSQNPSFPLGLRNNNPGNLRYNANIKWQGQIGQNKGFVVFRDIAYGIRAWGMDLKNDIKKGKDTIEKLIYEYAPPSENNTQAYIKNVEQYSGIKRTQPLHTDIDTLTKLARGFYNVELGLVYASKISDSDIREGLGMIGGLPGTIINSALPIILLLVIAAIIFYNK